MGLLLAHIIAGGELLLCLFSSSASASRQVQFCLKETQCHTPSLDLNFIVKRRYFDDLEVLNPTLPEGASHDSVVPARRLFCGSVIFVLPTLSTHPQLLQYFSTVSCYMQIQKNHQLHLSIYLGLNAKSKAPVNGFS